MKFTTQHCISCGNPCAGRKGSGLCGKCFNASRNEIYIRNWLSGIESGYGQYGQLSRSVKAYILARDDFKCVLCGWGERNVKTGKPAVVVDHIDGKWNNALPDNLRTLCPNCDAISPTYKALNKGNGHPSRRWLKKSTDNKGWTLEDSIADPG